MTHPARRLWQHTEPIHALTYFAIEAHAAYEAVGLRGFWRGYFAGRAGPLGPVGPGIVTAVFHGFAPTFVARALPSVWDLVTPADALDARLAGIDSALQGLFGDDLNSARVSEAADLATRAVDGCDPAARPLFAANVELSWPNEPHLALWHTTTLLREHRGDGHVAASTALGVDPCEAHVTRIAASGASPDTIQPYRGWTDDDWRAATERLHARGWLDRDELTPAGAAASEEIEAVTDRLAVGPVDRLGTNRFERLLELLRPLADRIAGAGVVPYPNPIGLTRA